MTAAATGVAAGVVEGIGWLRLDGADRLNAIGSQTYLAIADAVRAFERDSARAVVVHGDGRAFSAGADIDEISRFEGRDDFAAFIRGFTDALDVIASSRLPVVAAIHGSALGGGLELALACDVRIATVDAKLGLPEAKLGVLPGAGGTQRLPRLIPVGIATEMLMLGTTITAERAYAIGLVNRLVDGDSLLAEAGGLAAQLARGARQVAAATKSLLRETAPTSLADGIAVERDTVADLFATPDGREGFAAFTARRAPEFG
jgi:enoyl-CoA hydratase/carnithine racemase